MEYSTKQFAALVPCSADTIHRWRQFEDGISEPLLAPDHEDERGYPRYTEAQLPIARALLNQRKSTLKGKSSPDAVDTGGNISAAPMNDHNINSAQKNNAATSGYQNPNTDLNSEQLNHNKNTTAANISQAVVADSGKFSCARTILENLPAELLNQKRFFPVRITSDHRKLPCIKAWQLPNNQMTAQEAIKKTGLIGMDICGHGLNPDYFFVDFDHVKDQSGNFLYEDAERWNNYLSTAETFSEISISKDGTHYLFCPTPNLFPTLTGFNGGNAIYFDETKKGKDAPKIELFYGEGRYILLTGDGAPNTEILSGDPADEYCQHLCNQLALDISEIKDTADACTVAPIDSDISVEEVKKMLDVIPCAKVTYFDWFKTAAIIHYHFGEAGFELWRHWSETDPKRYTLANCQKQWSYITKRSADRVKSPATIGSLIFFAKKFGYHLPKKNVTFAPMNDDQHGNFIWTQDRIKSCPVNLRLPNGYIFDQRGITKIIPAKKETAPPKHICACRAPIIPTKKFREPTKGTLEYGLAIFSDDQWRNIEVSAATIGDIRELSKILNLHGGLVDEPKIVSQFINATIALNPEMQRIKSYNQTGWTSEDYDDFAFPSADGNAVVRRVGYDYERIFKPKGNPEEWKKKFLEIDKQAGAIGHVIIGGACSAPVIKPLQDLPNLQIHVYGKKSIGKTPMLKFAESIFGDTDVGALTHTFAATPKSRLETACAFSDLPIICEELESIGAKDTEKLSTDIYNFYLGIGGQALNKDGTKRAQKLFNSVRLTSGEHSLVPRNGNGGEFKRALELRCVTLLDEDFAADLYGFCKRNHGLFGEQWISYVINNWQLISKHYHRTFDTVKAAQVKGYENDLTQLRTLVISLVDYQHFKICIGLSNLATDADAINAEIVADINAVIAQLPTADEIDDTTRAIEFLKSFYVANLKHFASEVNKPEFDNEFSQGALECFGKDFKNGEVAFLPHILNRILTEDGGFKSAEKLIAEFYDKGYLRHSYGRNTYQTKISGKNIRAIRFKSGVITTAEEDNDTDATA